MTVSDDRVTEHLSGLVPTIVVPNVAEAIALYGRMFGATETHRFTAPDGRLVHAEVLIAGCAVELSLEDPASHNLGPRALGGTPVVIGIGVPDVDAVFARAVGAGATVLFPVADQFYGLRQGRLADPFGHSWSFWTEIEAVSAEEAQRRFDAGAR